MVAAAGYSSAPPMIQKQQCQKCQMKAATAENGENGAAYRQGRCHEVGQVHYETWQ
jgi:hypothetical protein